MGCEPSIEESPKPTTSAREIRAKTMSLKNRQLRTARFIHSPSPSTAGATAGDFEVTEEDWNLVEGTLQKHYLLYKAKGYAAKEIVNNLDKFELESGQVVFTKGDESTYFYVILSGRVAISDFDESGQVKLLGRGETFGDLGLQFRAIRSATATAHAPTRLLGLPKDIFVHITLELSKRAHQKIFKDLK